MLKKFAYDVTVGVVSIVASTAVIWSVNEYVYPLWRRRTMAKAIGDATRSPGPPNLQDGVNGAVVKQRSP